MNDGTENRKFVKIWEKLLRCVVFEREILMFTYFTWQRLVLASTRIRWKFSQVSHTDESSTHVSIRRSCASGCRFTIECCGSLALVTMKNWMQVVLEDIKMNNTVLHCNHGFAESQLAYIHFSSYKYINNPNF